MKVFQTTRIFPAAKVFVVIVVFTELTALHVAMIEKLIITVRAWGVSDTKVGIPTLYPMAPLFTRLYKAILPKKTFSLQMSLI